MKWAGHVAHMAEVRYLYIKLQSGNLKGKNYLPDLN
jgi:hypothetical protein